MGLERTNGMTDQFILVILKRIKFMVLVKNVGLTVSSIEDSLLTIKDVDLEF